MKRVNGNGDRLSLCGTPLTERMGGVFISSTTSEDEVFSNVEDISLKIRHVTPIAELLFASSILSILSKALAKSTKHTYYLPMLSMNNSISSIRAKLHLIAEKLHLKPTCDCRAIPLRSTYSKGRLKIRPE